MLAVLQPMRKSHALTGSPLWYIPVYSLCKGETFQSSFCRIIITPVNPFIELLCPIQRWPCHWHLPSPLCLYQEEKRLAMVKGIARWQAVSGSNWIEDGQHMTYEKPAPSQPRKPPPITRVSVCRSETNPIERCSMFLPSPAAQPCPNTDVLIILNLRSFLPSSLLSYTSRKHLKLKS